MNGRPARGLGPFPESYSEPGHRKMLENAVAWALDDRASGRGR